jgi:drug/metabolite transporter (DMT)-like permease
MFLYHLHARHIGFSISEIYHSGERDRALFVGDILVHSSVVAHLFDTLVDFEEELRFGSIVYGYGWPIGDSLLVVEKGAGVDVLKFLMKSVSGDYGAAFITRKVFFYGVLTILPYYLIIPGWPAWDVFMKPQVVGNLLFLGCLASMICFLTWNWCISKLGAVKATNWVYFNPITTMIFASLVLDEKITPYFLAGACCILAGMYIADRMTKAE